MSDTATHTRGSDSPLNLITGEPPGIKEILERRAAEGPLTEETRDPPEQKQADDAETAAAKEVADLRRRTTEAEARATEAEHARRVAENARQQAVQGAEDTGFTAINTALAAVTAEKTGLIAELKTAGEAGDFARMGEINVRLGEIGADIREFTRGKEQFEADRQRRINEPQRMAEPTGSATERGILSQLRAPSKEAFLASRTPETREFLNQNPQFFSDPSFHQRMIGAESLARGKGLVVDTPAYFDAIREAALGQTTTPPPRREASGAAPGTPPSRDVTGPTGRRTASGDVYVSQEDKVTADWIGVDPLEYVRERDALKARGEWPYRRR